MSNEDDIQTPDTYRKALGHEKLLNPEAEVCPNHQDSRDQGVVCSWSSIELGVFLPRETNTYHSFQTDGMMMKHPCMEGTVIPLQTYTADPGRLPERNYLEHDNETEMQLIWQELCDDIGILVEDVEPPNCYAQTQEGIRWVNVLEHNLERDNEWTDSYIPVYNDWVRWHESTGKPIAIVYRNCD